MEEEEEELESTPFVPKNELKKKSRLLCKFLSSPLRLCGSEFHILLYVVWCGMPLLKIKQQPTANPSESNSQ